MKVPSSDKYIHVGILPKCVIFVSSDLHSNMTLLNVAPTMHVFTLPKLSHITFLENQPKKEKKVHGPDPNTDVRSCRLFNNSITSKAVSEYSYNSVY